MLTFNLKKEWFEKINNGEKTHEYREVKPYWTTRIKNAFNYQHENMKDDGYIYFPHKPRNKIIFMKGYTGENIYAECVSIRIINGKDTDLKIDKDVYDIEFELVKEVNNDK